MTAESQTVDQEEVVMLCNGAVNSNKSTCNSRGTVGSSDLHQTEVTNGKVSQLESAVMSCTVSSHCLAMINDDRITNRRFYVCCSCNDLQSVKISGAVIIICG
jgi:hypothetical protein